MSPAQRRKKRLAQKAKKNPKKKGFLKLLIFLLLILAAYFVLLGRTAFWNGKDKLHLITNTASGDILVIVFDPRLSEITNITVPATTEVEVARGFGTWKARSVWELGVNEKVDGALLAETMLTSFGWPIYAWADKPAAFYSEANYASIIRATLTPYKTNLKMGDKIRLALFASKVKNPNRINIDLSTTQALNKARLVDGEEGYQVTGLMPERIRPLFTDLEIAQNNLRVAIRDGTKRTITAERVGRVIETVGAKVAVISKEEIGEDFECLVAGADESAVNKVARIFNCEKSNERVGGFDLEIKISEAFAKRF